MWGGDSPDQYIFPFFRYLIFSLPCCILTSSGSPSSFEFEGSGEEIYSKRDQLRFSAAALDLQKGANQKGGFVGSGMVGFFE